MLLLYPFYIWENRIHPMQALSGAVPGFNPRQFILRAQPLNRCTIPLFSQLYLCKTRRMWYSGTTIRVLNCTDLHLCIEKPPGLSYPPPPDEEGQWEVASFTHLHQGLHVNLLEWSAKKSNITIYFMGPFLYLITIPIVRLQGVEGQGPFLLSLHSPGP